MLLREIPTAKYDAGKLEFSLEIPVEANGIRFRFDRNGWPEGKCLTLTFTATCADGISTTKGPATFAGLQNNKLPKGAIQRGTTCGKSWQWGGIGGWCSAETDQDGRPVLKDPGEEKARPVFATKNDAGETKEQPLVFHKPATISVVVEFLQTLETPILAEGF